MRIDVMDGETVIRTIIADEASAEAQYPGAWRVAAIQDTSTNPTPAEIAMQTIARLEREQIMPRATREFMLVFMEAQAQEMGVSLETLMTKNALYRRVKEFDDQIAALRAQL